MVIVLYFLQYVNPAFEKLTGFNKADILGNSTNVLINEDKTGKVNVNIAVVYRSADWCSL